MQPEANRRKRQWIRLSLYHLSIVALLGTLLRSKILFPISWINFGYLLNAHSHFAFGGWVTLILMVLLVYEILPEPLHTKRIYQWLLAGIAFSAWGMLISFPFEGYAFFSILFSTLFIFVTYVFSWVLIADLKKTDASSTIKLLVFAALTCLVVSSAGPYILAYLLATHSGNFLLYKDAVYTYLHFQYNGFFTLSVLALFFNKIKGMLSDVQYRKARMFAVFMVLSILPSMFLSYLWQYPSALFRSIAILGVILILISTLYFVFILSSVRKFFSGQIARELSILAFTAFILKMLLQSGTILPAIGNEVFGDRPIIIGFLHLVFLGFVSLFILAYLLQTNILSIENKAAAIGIKIFAASVVANELVLMLQGLGIMFKTNSTIYAWLLWLIAVGLLAGALSIAISNRTKKLNH